MPLLRAEIVPVGTGKEDTLVFPGLYGTPADYLPLAKSMGSTFGVLNNPRHSQPDHYKNLKGHAWEEWQESVREEIRALKGIKRIIGHSRGVVDELQLDNLFPDAELVVLAPPVRDKPAEKQARNSGAVEIGGDSIRNMLHTTLAPLFHSLSDDQYAKIFDAHLQWYGSQLQMIMRKEGPSKTNVPGKTRRVLDRAAQDGRPMKIIRGQEDPWDLPEYFDALKKAYPGLPVFALATGHYPHIEMPDDVAGILLGAPEKIVSLRTIPAHLASADVAALKLH